MHLMCPRWCIISISIWTTNGIKKHKISELYDKCKTATNEMTESLTGLRRNETEGFSPEVETLCQNQKEGRFNMRRNPAEASTREIYETLNKRIKHEVSVHKSKLLDQKIKQMEDDYTRSNSLNLFKTARELER